MDISQYSGVFIDDGLGPKASARYKKRRQKFRCQFDYPVILYGLDMGPNHHYPWAHISSPLFQDPLLLYLTGINQSQTALFLDPISQTDTVFLPDYDATHIFWDGPQLAYGDEALQTFISRITGIRSIRPISELNAFLVAFIQSHSLSKIGTLWHRSIRHKRRSIVRDSHYYFRRQLHRLFRTHHLDLDCVNISPSFWDIRCSLDATNVKNVKTALQKTHQAFLALLKRLPECSSETDVSGILSGELLQHSSFGLSFPPIVASGANATILHYIKNNDVLAPQSLLLLDFGVKWQLSQSDISRTIPISGRFNPLQSLLYTIVLDTQIYIESLVKPGVSIVDINHLAWQFLHGLLDSRFTRFGGKMSLPYDKFPHFVSHLIGIQVHDGDPFGDYRHRPLKPTWLISNEPGLYGHFEIKMENTHFSETIGIRIEDNLLITRAGCDNLSADIPKSISDIESLIPSANRSA